MSASESQSGYDPRPEEVLTLAEAAAHLRVPEAELAQLATDGGVPARKIGGEWRFLRKGLEDWLRYPGHPHREGWMVHPRWLMESPFAEELLFLLEERLLRKLKPLAPPSPKPGSKQAVLKHFGILRDDADVEERLADAKARRKAGGG
jgi:excisionase family DNA binding protein